MLGQLEARFETQLLRMRPYFFPDLEEIREEVEQAAIDAGEIRATGIQYVGRKSSSSTLPEDRIGPP